MIKQIGTLAAVVALSFSHGVEMANASDASTCAGEVALLRNAINAAVFLGATASSNKSNLLAKVEGASAKLARDKPLDAIDIFLSISAKATELADAPKPKLQDATEINSSAEVAITCVGIPG